MEMFNLFKINTQDFKKMLQINGSEIYVNGNKKYALISNPPDVRDFNDKYISTDFNMERGDYVFYDNKYWMLISQVGTSRYESYKALMRQVEHDVVFNFFYFGEMTNYLLECPAIISRTSDFTQSFDRTSGTISVSSEIHVFVKDTERTRKIIDMTNKPDGQIVLGERNYDITGVSIENAGVLDITCTMGNRNTASNYTDNIYWDANGSPSDWQDNYDLSLYEMEGSTPNKPSAPNALQTNVDTIIAIDIVNQTGNSLGSITFNWLHDASKSIYNGFGGYKLQLFKDGSEIASINTSGLSQSFDNLVAGSYNVKISILFTTYGADEASTPQVSEAFVINNETIKPLPPTDFETNVVPMDITGVGETVEDGDGVVTYTWSKDINAEQYSGFVGYKLTLTSNGLESYSVSLDKDTLSYQWINNHEGQYAGYIQTIFINDDITTLGTRKYFPSVIIQDNFSDDGGLW